LRLLRRSLLRLRHGLQPRLIQLAEPDRQLPTLAVALELDGNFVAEDVPVGLMPILALGSVGGVAMPATKALIDFSCIMTGTDYAQDARTLARMGLAGQDVAGIRRIVDNGF